MGRHEADVMLEGGGNQQPMIFLKTTKNRTLKADILENTLDFGYTGIEKVQRLYRRLLYSHYWRDFLNKCEYK